MIIWGFGKVTRSRKGGVFQKKCSHCNRESIWQLCKKTTWFTLFFIPVIPYRVTYCVECPNCKSYIEVTKEKFHEIEADIKNKRELGYDV